jgi:RNA-splicing ligase RtcB
MDGGGGNPWGSPGDGALPSLVIRLPPPAAQHLQVERLRLNTARSSKCRPLMYGAGRVMSRHAAVRSAHGRRIDQQLREQGVVARARSWKGLAEEQPGAYKDVNHVVDVVHEAGLAKKVARLRPIGVIKG